MATIKQNTVYIYADGKTESFDAGFGYRSMHLEMETTMNCHAFERRREGKSEPISLLFIQQGIPIGVFTGGRLITVKSH